MGFHRREGCGSAVCDAPPEETRAYLVGWRCPKHTPAALAGKPEPLSSGPHYVAPPRSEASTERLAAAAAGRDNEQPSRPASREAIARARRLAHEAGSRPVDTPHAFTGRTVTSAAAAAKVLPKTGTQRRQVLDAIVEAHVAGHLGATDPELSRHLGMGANSVRPRRNELATAGLVVDTGHTRQHEGNAHTVWGPSSGALGACRVLPSD